MRTCADFQRHGKMSGAISARRHSLESRKVTTENKYPVGERWVFDIGIAEIEHYYVSAVEMRYRILTGARAGETGSVSLDVVPIGDRVFFVSWQEHDRSTVVHLEDFSKGTFVSCYTSPNAEFHRTHGRMRRA